MTSTRSACVIAIDVGGTAIKAGLVDRGGTVLHSYGAPTDLAGGADGVITQIIAVAGELEAAAAARGLVPQAVGVVVLGLVDDDAGVAVLSAAAGWRDVPMRALLADKIDLALAFGHDVRAGGLAEAELGAGRGSAAHFFLAIGTGICGASVIDGRPYIGTGYAGEIGHVRVEPDGRACGCGGRGCLETVASARAIARRYQERTGRTADATEVAARVAAGDEVAAAVWDEAVDALAGALAAYVSLLAPDRIVIGGGLAQAGEWLLGPLRERLRSRLSFQRMPDVVPAELGDQAGCIGAALLAWEVVGA